MLLWQWCWLQGCPRVDGGRNVVVVVAVIVVLVVVVVVSKVKSG